MAEYRLYSAVHIQHPGLGQQRRRAIVQVALQPFRPLVSSILARPRRTVFSLTALRMPSKGGLTGSQRGAVNARSGGGRPAPKARFFGAFGLVKLSGQSATQASTVRLA
jgi:hypothetical protein